MKTRQRLELLLEDLPCEHDPKEYYETTDQLLEPLLLCYESLQSCGSDILADGRLANLIRRVSTFGMVLMKLDVRQESCRHAETLDAITKYLDMGVYSEWDEEKKLEFLTKELKGRRPLVPPTIELIFSLSRYKAVIDAYLDGLESSGLSDLSRLTSVASFFVSHVDIPVDKVLEKIGTPEALDLRGKYVMIARGSMLMLFEGTEQPTAYGDMIFIGGPNSDVNKKLSVVIAQILEMRNSFKPFLSLVKSQS